MTSINDVVSLSGTAAVRSAAQERQAALTQTPASGAVQSPDRVELSLGKVQVERLKQIAPAEETVRADRVAALKQQVAAGTYGVEGRFVAGKMLALFR
uniref:Negative regulator of flagellin synthesis n=1 Tax=Geobacter metallireducens TaxID=28232 RepID=A0A831XFI4_GEOME